MKIEELIGKKIKDILVEISEYRYEGSIPLEECDSRLVLASGEVIVIPYNDPTDLEIDWEITENQQSIFTKDMQPGLLDKVVGKSRHLQKLFSPKIDHIAGSEIIGVYDYESGFSETNREWEKCLIEVEGGALFSEKILAPMGTGHAGIWLFSSKNDLRNKIGAGFRQIC